MFPDPSHTGAFHTSSQQTWSVYDAAGREVAAGDDLRVDLSTQSVGIYFFKTTTQTIKLVIK
ncbi:T9SS type A sorting domain-containing protein [Nonlabens xiamenensis]|uniref:T9SS type A sorting domain-containing protein n=1 Tax=Nonlabens xiamenensis TaxID=2341043 RepID=UPI000F60EBC0|nr:T9SS type A sorting domain-containing protein [Nonlabens xiamenensis]